MCECYTINQPSADPYCEAHGDIATSQREQYEAKIAELEAKITKLESNREKRVDLVKRVYNKFDPLNEEDRLTRILHTEGLLAAIATAKNLKKIYLKASLSTRQKYHTRTYPYRYAYIESAHSIRHILRTKFLETLDRIA